MPTPLPEPDADARAHSARVVAAVAAAIDAAGGFLTLARYIELVLYAPGLGYYAAGAAKLGAAGDFVTGPETTALFGTAMAAQVAPILAGSRDRMLLELGAGSGTLAVDLLAALAKRDALPDRYVILEVSPDLRERQQGIVAARIPALAARIEWCDRLPARVDGAIVMNEVLDAVPPHVIVRRDGAWHERGVAMRGGALALDLRPLVDARLLSLARSRFPPDVDYASEINPAAEALVHSLARRLAGGALLVVDYGFSRAEFYHPQRSDGTLVAHYRHRVLHDVLSHPGLMDLTAHVDFTAIAEAGERAGLHVAGYASQGAFLVGCGIHDALAVTGDARGLAYLREASAVQRLVSPAEMGELFKVLALARDEDIEWPGFALSDRSARL